MDVKVLSNELVYVGREISFPRAISLNFASGEEAPVALTFVLNYSNTKGRYVLSQTSVSGTPPDQEITGQLIRAIPFQEILLKGLAQLKYFDLNTQGFSRYPAIEFKPSDRDEMVQRGPDQQTLETVALLYRIAEVLNTNQGKHLERVLQIPYATAANWISRAKKQQAFEALQDATKRYNGLTAAPPELLLDIASTHRGSRK